MKLKSEKDKSDSEKIISNFSRKLFRKVQNHKKTQDRTKMILIVTNIFSTRT